MLSNSIARREGGRPVVLHREAVHHVLRVVLRPARVQHAVGLQQPARLLRHQRDHVAARKTGFALPDLSRAHVIGPGGAVGIDQRVRLGHLQLGRDRLDPERHRSDLRQLRPDLDQLGGRHKAAPCHQQPVNPERQVLEGVPPVRPQIDALLGVGRLAHQVGAGGHRSAGAVQHRQADFARAPLPEPGLSQQKEQETARHGCWETV